MTDGTRLEGQRRLTHVALPLLAMAAVQLFRAEHQWHRWFVAIDSLLVLLVAAALFVLFERWSPISPSSGGRIRWASGLPTGATSLLVGFAFLPVLVQAVVRPWDIGDPTEVVMMMCVQNGALGSAVAAPRWRYRQIAVLLSSFLTMFVVFAAVTPPILVTAGLFAFVGLWWLMGSYWERLVSRMATHTYRQVPMYGAVLVMTALSLLVGAGAGVLWGAGATPRLLAGFMPTSGGDRWGDAFGRGGVGDGEQLIAAEDEASTFGPVESELFLSSEQPSLYDTYNDMYGEPIVQKEHRRAIALESEQGRESEQRIAESQQTGREFAMVRRRADRFRPEVADRRSPALFLLSGSVPLHLRMETFDHFDGIAWSRAGAAKRTPAIRLDESVERAWMRVHRFDPYEILAGKQACAVKIINLRSNRIPAPSNLVAWHIDRVDQPSFFGWTDDDVPALVAQDHIPALTVIHLVAQGWSVGGLERLNEFLTRENVESPYTHVPQPAHAATAREWTADTPRGLPQVIRVIDRLRQRYVHLPDHVVPEQCQDVVSHFLETGAGPDYLFATTAAVLLRSLGYPARVVSGFYASPERYDPKSRHTVVGQEDVHFWVEVCVDSSNWLPLEPTPGYEPPAELRTWWQRCAVGLAAGWRWVRRQWLLLSGVAVLSVLAAVLRHALFDLVSCGLWWVGCRGTARRQVLWTLRVVEWRAWLAGRGRPKTSTVAAWYPRLTPWLSPGGAAALRDLMTLADWALYADQCDESSFRAARVRAILWRVAWSATAWQWRRDRERGERLVRWARATGRRVAGPALGKLRGAPRAASNRLFIER